MNGKAWLTVLAFVLWAGGSWYWYVCRIQQSCPQWEQQAPSATHQTSEVEAEAPPPAPVDQPCPYPLGSKWSSPELETGPGYAQLKDSLLQALGEDNILEIIGIWYEGEQAPAGQPNLGLARAQRFREMLGEALPDERVTISSRRLTPPEGIQGQWIEALDFNFIAPDKPEEVEIVEVENRIEVHFPFNSTQAEIDQRVRDYLEKLATRLKQTDETVTIVGHTDNIGDEDANYRLGLMRAQAMRDELVRKGVDPARIRVMSKGETEPIATNDTEQGRRKNRRAEIILESGDQ
ncbi:MAG: OmpA family protein [Bacteroidetes bacterium]|nr:MAG: OmpA family protein [Bacteroidota bacterium]